MDGSWRRWSLCGAIACGTFFPSAGCASAGIIPWPWREKHPPKMTAERAEREAYYAARACEPVSSKQFEKHGKLWPPYPRPAGPANLPSHIYHAAHYWPWPYVCQDRQSVREHEEILEEAGWVSETTLYDYHFDNDQHTLNRAGLIHLRWILQNAPENRRTVYVQAGSSNGQSQMRATNVTEELTEMIPVGSIPPVVLRVTTPLGRPASEVDKIQRSQTESTPKPRITPPFSAGGLGDGGATEGSKGQ